MAIRQPPHAPAGQWSGYHGKHMTEAEFLALDDAAETDLEYVDGTAVEKGMVDRNHGVLVGEISGHLWLYCREHGGEFGPERRLRLPTGRYRKPDCAYWRPGVPAGNDSIPSLAIEVRSPGESMESQRRKCREYREAGVLVCWLVDPISRAGEVSEDDIDAEPLAPDGVLASEHLPGFELLVAELMSILDG